MPKCQIESWIYLQVSSHVQDVKFLEQPTSLDGAMCFCSRVRRSSLSAWSPLAAWNLGLHGNEIHLEQSRKGDFGSSRGVMSITRYKCTTSVSCGISALEVGEYHTIPAAAGEFLSRSEHRADLCKYSKIRSPDLLTSPCKYVGFCHRLNSAHS